MMKPLSALIAASLLLAQPTPSFAQYTLNLRDADVRAFVDDAARVTGYTFVVDSRVNQKISVVTQRSLSRSEYFEVFLSTLRANGLVAVPISGGYRVQPIAGAATAASRVSPQRAARDEFITEIFRLNAVDAAGAVETLRPLISSEGSITANRNANSLVVVDYADNVARIRQLIGRIDRNNDASEILYLENAGAREIADSLATLIGTPGEGGVAPVTVSAIDSSNALALRGEPGAVARFAQIARQLDAQASAGAEIRVYWLQNADAEQLLPVLQQLLGQPVTAPGAQPAFIQGQVGEGTGAGPAAPSYAPVQTPTPQSGGQGIVRRGPAVVARYSGTNALIIAANADIQRQLGEVIRQLDTRREQVLIEAIIVEIGDNAARELGVQFLLADQNGGFAATNYSNAQPNVIALGGAYANYELGRENSVNSDGVVTTSVDNPLGQAVTDAAVGSLLGSTGALVGGIIESGSGLFGAIVNAVQSDTESNVLLTPSIMTLDNQEARLLVGQEVPVTTGEALSSDFDNAFRTVQRQNVGVQLDVKPQVNGSGSIKLFIRQEVSSVAGPVARNSSDLVINKREFKTVLTVDDGDILAIGGLLDDNERNTIEKVPLLGDIPLVGELFKSRSRSRSKTNLMVFIRPTIVRTRADAQALSAQRYGYIRGAQLLRNPDEEPAIDTLVRDYLGTVPPAPLPLGPGDRVFRPDPVLSVDVEPAPLPPANPGDAQ